MEAFKGALGRLFGDSRVGDCEAAISAGATQSFGWPGWPMTKWYNVSGTNQATSDVVKLIGSFLNPPVGGGSMAARGRSMLAGLKNLSKTGWVLVLLLVLAVLFVYYQLDQIVWRGVRRAFRLKPTPGSGTALLIKVVFKVSLGVAAETVSTVARGVQSVALGVGSGLGSTVRGARDAAGLAVNSVRAGAGAVIRQVRGDGNQKFGSDSSDYTLRDVDELALGSDVSASRESLGEVDWNATMLAVQDACIYVTDPIAATATATATTTMARAHAQNAVVYQAGVLRDVMVVSGERGSAYIQVRDALRAAWPYATEVTHAQAAESMRKTIDILVERAQRTTRDVMVGATGIGLGQIARLLLRSAAGKEHAVPKVDFAWSAHVEDARVLLDLREESERITQRAPGEAGAGRARGCIFPVACDGKGNNARTNNERKAGNGTATAGTLCECMKRPLESRLLCREHTAKIRGKMQEMKEAGVASGGTIEGALIAWLVAELAGGELKGTGIRESDDAARQMLAEMRAASLWLPAKAREVPSFGSNGNGKPKGRRGNRRQGKRVEAAKQAEATAALGLVVVKTEVARLNAASRVPADARVATVAAGAVSKFTPAEEGFIKYHKANGTSQASELETDVLNRRGLRLKLRNRMSSVSMLSHAVDGIIADLENCVEEDESVTLDDATRIVTLLANADAENQKSARVLLGLANKALLRVILAKAHTDQSQSRGTVCVPAGTVCAMINRHLPAFLAHQEPEKHADLAEVAELLVGVISAVESGIDAANDVSKVIGALRAVQSTHQQDVRGNRPSDAQVGAFIQALEQISKCTILYCEREGGEGGQGGLPDLLGGLASLGSSKCRLAVAWLSAKLMAGRSSPDGDSGSIDPIDPSSAFGMDFLNNVFSGGARLANSALGAAGTVLEHGGDIADFTEAVTGCSAEIEKRVLVFVKLFVNMYHVLVSDNAETIKTTSTLLSAVKLSALSAEEQETIAEADALLKAKQASFGGNASPDQNDASNPTATPQTVPTSTPLAIPGQGRIARAADYAKSKADAAGAYIASIWKMIVEFFVAIPGYLLALAKKGAGNGGSVTNLLGDLAQLLLDKIRALVQDATAKLASGAALEWGDILGLFSAGGAGALKCAYEIRRWFVGDEGLLSILRNPLSVLKGNPLKVGTRHLRALSYAVAAAVMARFAQLILLFGTEMQAAVQRVIGDAVGATAHAGTTIKAGVTNVRSYLSAKTDSTSV